jgi:hypothetical protein
MWHYQYMQENTFTSTRSSSLVGSNHRFGKDGVLHEVISAAINDAAVIRVLETGEETTYPIADILDDPTE